MSRLAWTLMAGAAVLLTACGGGSSGTKASAPAIGPPKPVTGELLDGHVGVPVTVSGQHFKVTVVGPTQIASQLPGLAGSSTPGTTFVGVRVSFAVLQATPMVPILDLPAHLLVREDAVPPPVASRLGASFLCSKTGEPHPPPKGWCGLHEGDSAYVAWDDRVHTNGVPIPAGTSATALLYWTAVPTPVTAANLSFQLSTASDANSTTLTKTRPIGLG